MALDPISLIGGGIGAVGSLIGAIGSARQMKKARKNLQNQRAKNQAWYDKEYNTDYTQRSDTQQVLNKTREMADANRRRARNMGVVAGATDEAVAMENEASNKMVGDTMGAINASADAYKQNIQGQYKQTEQGLDNAEYNSYVQQAGQIAQAGTEIGKAGAGIIGSIFDKAKTVVPPVKID